MNKSVNLTKRVKTPNGPRFCAVARSTNGRIKANYVEIAGREEQLSTEMVSFQLDRDGHARPQLFVIHPSDQPDDAGEDRVLIEFEDNKTPRAKLWHRRIDKLKPDDQIAALAKLVEDFEVSAGVGGPIDSVRITPFGVQWLSAKPECGPHPTKPRK
jgi:hypothetical protein